MTPPSPVPGQTAPGPTAPLSARFLRRSNRFVVDAALDADDEPVRAYLPNTARLHDLLVPGAPLLLEPSTDPTRRTRYTVTRVADGSTWVSLEASRAADLLVTHVRATGRFPVAGEIAAVEREIVVGAHRIDLRLRTVEGDPWLVEVKSLSRAVGGDAPLSATPSTRGTSQLRLLSELTRRGERAAVVFVVQRGDVERLVVGPHADATWVEAVRAAAAAGVTVAAFRCRVGPTHVTIDHPLPVVRGDHADVADGP